MHGGIISTLLDSAMACAVHTTLDPGYGYTTLDLHVNFVRATRPGDDRIVGDAHVVHRGRRVATVNGTVTAADGRLLAHGTSTYLVIAPDGADTRPTADPHKER